ncbi:MAG: alkaline phosphatase family protein, partial [Inhella sp.]
EAWKGQFGPDGFRRFLDHGSTWAQASYLHAHTVTGVGHASMLTGATPALHGIISNEWTDPRTRHGLYCAEDRRLDHANPEVSYW